jgi:hypothetical protein
MFLLPVELFSLGKKIPVLGFKKKKRDLSPDNCEEVMNEPDWIELIKRVDHYIDDALSVGMKSMILKGSTFSRYEHYVVRYYKSRGYGVNIHSVWKTLGVCTETVDGGPGYGDMCMCPDGHSRSVETQCEIIF